MVSTDQAGQTLYVSASTNHPGFTLSCLSRRLVLVVSLLCGTTVYAVPNGCSSEGCDYVRGFDSFGEVPALQPRQLWLDTRFKALPNGNLGCSSDGHLLACMVADDETGRSETNSSSGNSRGTNGKRGGSGGSAQLIVFNTADGKVEFVDSSVGGPTVPLLMQGGFSITCNAERLTYAQPDGKLVWTSELTMHTDTVFSPTVASNAIILVTAADGWLATYVSSGVPHAGIPLNGTVQGVNGMFLPMGTPALYLTRAYVFTRFQGQKGTTSGHGRVWAVDMHHSIDERLTVGWTFDFELPLTTTAAAGDFSVPWPIPLAAIPGGVVFGGRLIGAPPLVRHQLIALDDTTAFVGPDGRKKSERNSSPKVRFGLPVPSRVQSIALDSRTARTSAWVTFADHLSLWQVNLTSGTAISTHDLHKEAGLPTGSRFASPPVLARSPSGQLVAVTTVTLPDGNPTILLALLLPSPHGSPGRTSVLWKYPIGSGAGEGTANPIGQVAFGAASEDGKRGPTVHLLTSEGLLTLE